MIVLLLTVALSTLVTCASANCEACVAGWCHSRKTLIEGFNATDQLAIDHTNNVLYVQLNSDLNSALFLDDLKIKVVRRMNTSGLAVDQETQDLYVSDYNNNVYKYKYGSDQAQVIHVDLVDSLFYQSKLYYTRRDAKCLRALANEVSFQRYHTLCNMTISDFVVTKDNKMYFVTDGKVYVYMQSTEFDLAPTELVANKSYVLSTDKQGNVYLGDSEFNIIYKLNEARELVRYAAYKTGSVDRFVFDKDNSIVFHDAVDGNVFTWKKGATQCNIHPPNKFTIEEISCQYQTSPEDQDESATEQIQ